VAAAGVQAAEAARVPVRAGPGGRNASVGRVGSTAGTLGLPELAALVAGADLLLSGDTGVAHLGTAFGAPSVLLFGPTPPALWRPLVDQDRHTVLWHGVGAADPHGPDLDPALSKIDVDEVVAAAERLLRG
jgi:ADP-heptose:LPS heptosyltransferase